MTEQTMTVAELAALKVHPLARLFPLLTGDDAKRFTARLKEAGRIEVPPTLIERDGEPLVLDGQNRQAFAPQALPPDSPVPVEIFEGDEAAALALVMRRNFSRRHQSGGQRALITARLTLKPDSGNCNLGYTPISQVEAADMAGVARKTINVAVKVLKKAEPFMIADIETGKTTLAKVAEFLDRQAADKRRDAERRKDERELVERNAATDRATETIADAPADLPDAPDPDAGADIAETPDDASSAAPESVAETPTKAQPKKTKSADKKAEAKQTPKQTPKQKAEEAHDRPLIDKAQADAAKDAANFAVEWITAHASDAGEFKTVADALRKATANAPALAVLRHLLLEGGANCGNGAVNKDAEIARLKAQLALWTGEDADAHSHNAE